MRGPRRAFIGSAKRHSTDQPDPYGPSSPDQDVRNQMTEVILAPGVTRIDIGEPIKIIGPQSRTIPRLPAASAAPVPQGAPADIQRVAVGAPKVTAERSWRDDYGVAKRP